MNLTPSAPILIVEDDEAIRHTVTDCLELNGFEWIMATNGVDGLARARRERPALIITDLAMPGMNGFELLAEVRKDDTLRSVPVIVITANADRPAGRRAMDLGADDFITKPFTEAELIYSVRTRLVKKELLDELDAFAHTVAHDLRNPLATLLGRLSLLQYAVNKNEKEMTQRNLTEAVNTAKRLDTIIDELLLLAGVRRMQVRPRALAMNELVAEAIARLEDLLKQSGAKVTAPETWPAAMGHPEWVVHVWSNYIGNAATYGGPHAEITLGSEVVADGRMVRFSVQDRGAGMDAAAQAKLFVPFASISSVRTKGHGLGLSIVRRIIEKLGGTVGVESAPGAGTCFWFELPRANLPSAS